MLLLAWRPALHSLGCVFGTCMACNSAHPRGRVVNTGTACSCLYHRTLHSCCVCSVHDVIVPWAMEVRALPVRSPDPWARISCMEAAMSRGSRRPQHGSSLTPGPAFCDGIRPCGFSICTQQASCSCILGSAMSQQQPNSSKHPKLDPTESMRSPLPQY